MIIEEHIFFFILFGFFGVALEVFCTSLSSFKNKKNDICLKGNSSIWMFFVYGFVYFIVLFVLNYFSDFHILLRGFAYMILFYSLEFTSGLFLKRCRVIPWNYSSDTKYNYKGIVRLDFAPLWFIGGLFSELMYVYIKAHLIF
ncbi:MAG: hypothetical protein M1416_01530 [Candidatus Pacearchaeota archaeon]|nr:hypothetical protein [Candidatus Pacearchaeota archaeon]